MNYHFLSDTILFRGCSDEDIKSLLDISKTSDRIYKKGDIILHAGDVATSLGIILEGSVQIEYIDMMGNTSILGISEMGDVFAESYACIPDQPMFVDVIAREKCEILFLNVQSIFANAASSPTAAKVLQNLVRVFSRKNLGLSMRIFHTSPKTIRARLYSYFSQQITLQGCTEFNIPFNRQQFADYLSVDRVALSKELGKMRDEGIIEFDKNHFIIHQPE